MTDREEGLAALRASVGGIDPVLDNAADYARGVKEMQKTVRQQGQVMQATLANNHNLYHTNKKLVPENRALKQRVTELERERDELQRRLDEATLDMVAETPEQSRRYKLLWQRAMKTLAAYGYDLLDADQLKERMEEMKAQAAEIEALPERATPEYIAQREYADPYNPQAQAEAHLQRELARANTGHRD